MLRVFILLISVTAFTEGHAAECFWTITRNETEFKKSQVFNEAPQIQRAACNANTPPICMGWVYCPPPRGTPRPAANAGPSAEGVACSAIKVNNKWRCPDADKCFSDGDVTISKLTDNPGAPTPSTAKPAPTEPAEPPETTE